MQLPQGDMTRNLLCNDIRCSKSVRSWPTFASNSASSPSSTAATSTCESWDSVFADKQLSP
jgi:hypothetical protein